MKRSMLSFVASLALASVSMGAGTIDFEDLPLPAGSFENGSGLSGSFSSGGATFNNSYSASFGAWTGWAYSSVEDGTTAGFGNQYAAKPGAGFGGSGNYGLAFGDPNFDVVSIVIPAGERFVSMKASTSTYSYFSMLTGDAFAKKFGGPSGNDPDRFGWTISGTDEFGQSTGSIELLLANFTFQNNALDYVIADWIDVDLTPLGSAVRLDFAAFSTDTIDFGGILFLNTPAYLAVDNIVTVPEVHTFALMGVAIGMGALVRRARKV